jgi:hypothetical protein
MIKSAIQDYGYENDDILNDVVSSFSSFSCASGDVVGPIFAGILTDSIGFKSTCAIAAGMNLVSGIAFAIGTGTLSSFRARNKYNSL